MEMKAELNSLASDQPSVDLVVPVIFQCPHLVFAGTDWEKVWAGEWESKYRMAAYIDTTDTVKAYRSSPTLLQDRLCLKLAQEWQSYGGQAPPPHHIHTHERTHPIITTNRATRLLHHEAVSLATVRRQRKSQLNLLNGEIRNLRLRRVQW